MLFRSTGKDVLISGFKTPWTVNCEYEFTMQHYTEVNYAIIPHTQLCGCAIMGIGMHVKSFLEGCAQKKRKPFQPVFPINAAVVLMSFPIDISFNISKLYTHAKQITAKPAVPVILEANDDSIAANNEEFQKINLLRLWNWRTKDSRYMSLNPTSPSLTII